MISEAEKQRRRQLADESIHSVMLEGLAVSDEQRQIFSDYSEGLITLEEKPRFYA